MPQSRYQKRYAPGASRSSAGLILTRGATGATLARLIAYVDLQSGCPNTRQADARVFPPSKSLERIGDDPHRGRFPLLDATDDDEEEVVLALTARSTWLGSSRIESGRSPVCTLSSKKTPLCRTRIPAARSRTRGAAPAACPELRPWSGPGPSAGSAARRRRRTLMKWRRPIVLRGVKVDRVLVMTAAPCCLSHSGIVIHLAPRLAPLEPSAGLRKPPTSRDGGIRTRDPLTPSQVRYQAALRPGTANPPDQRRAPLP